VPAIDPLGRSPADWRRAALIAIGLLTLWRILCLAFTPLQLDYEEAQYWFWAQEPAWGYFSKPPLIAWLIRLSTALFGDGEFGIRLPSPVMHGIAALVAGAAAARLADARAGFWTAIAYATLPGVAFSALLMTTDVPLLLAWSLALYGFVRMAGEGGSTGWAIWTGLAVGLGALAKYAMAFFLPGVALALLCLPGLARRVGVARLAIMVGVALLVFLPNLLWNLDQGWITVRHTGLPAVEASLSQRLGKIGAFLGGQVAIAGPILLVAMLGGLGAGFRRWRRADTALSPLPLMAAFALPLFVVYLPVALFAQSNANWTAPAFVAAVIAGVLYWLQRGKLLWLKLALALNLAIAVLGPGLLVVASHIAAAGPLLKGMSGWREIGAEVVAERGREPGATLLFADRTFAQRVIYYAGLERGQFAMWNPDGTIDNELERVASLDAGAAGPWLLVTPRPAPAALTDRFETRGERREIAATLADGSERTVYLQRLEGFRGYAP